MSDDRDRGVIDPRIHAYLDGELSPSETAAFEGELRSGTVSESQLRTLKHLGVWFRSTRSRAPSTLFRSVERALEQERAPAVRSRPSPSRGRWLSGPALRWAWVPAAALAAAVIVLSIIPHRRVTGPSDGIPLPSERAMVPPDQAPPAETAGTPAEKSVRYVFTVSAEDAKVVCLAGDFNQWRVCEAPLERVEGDTWSIAVELPPGRHEYMFVIDGKWVTDPRAMGYVKDGFGNRNAVVVV